jgi:hypothetical protein
MVGRQSVAKRPAARLGAFLDGSVSDKELSWPLSAGLGRRATRGKQEGQVIRKLSRIEQWWIHFEDKWPLRFAVKVRVRGEITAEHLKAALYKLQQKHPLLAVRVTLTPSGVPGLTRDGVPEIPLRVIENVRSHDWERAMIEGLSEPFALRTGPLVRVIWLNGDGWSDLVVICHHAIADGLATVQLIRDLLGYLGDPAAPAEPLELLPPLSEFMPPEVDAALARMPVSDLFDRGLARPSGYKLGLFWRLLMRLIFGLLRSPLGPPMIRAIKARSAQQGPQHAATPECVDPSVWHCDAWSLSEAKTAALAAHAKREGTTVHAALATAFLCASQQSTDTGHRTATLHIPVNLRNRLSRPVGESVGYFSGSVSVKVDCSPARKFWDIARDLKERMDRAMTPEGLFAIHGLSKRLDSILGEAVVGGLPGVTDGKDPFANLDPPPMTVSNLGRLDIPTTYGSLSLESLYCPASLGLGSGLLNGVGVNTTGGRMFFISLFRRDIVPQSASEQFRESAMSRLDHAVGMRSMP